MHVLTWTVAGLVLLAAFLAIAAAANKGREGARFDGARVFLWVWLLAALGNAYNGWANHGIALVNEIAAFAPIFGIPALASWYWSRQRKG